MPLKYEPREPLRVNVFFQHIQNMLPRESVVIAETKILGLTAES